MKPLISNEYRTVSMTIRAVRLAAEQELGCSDDPLLILLQIEAEYGSVQDIDLDDFLTNPRGILK